MHAAIKDLQLYHSQPCQEISLEQQVKEDELDEHIQAAITANGTNLCIYFQKAGEETLAIDQFGEEQEKYFGWWYNPKNGKFYTVGGEETERAVSYQAKEHKLKVKTPVGEEKQDWLLILKKEEGELPIKKIAAEEETEEAEIKKVFEW